MELKIKIHNADLAGSEINVHSAAAVVQALNPFLCLREGIKLIVDEEAQANARFHEMFSDADREIWRKRLETLGRQVFSGVNVSPPSDSDRAYLFYKVARSPLHKDDMEVVSIQHGCMEHVFKDDVKKVVKKFKDVVKGIGDWIKSKREPAQPQEQQGLIQKVKLKFIDIMSNATPIQYVGFEMAMIAAQELDEILVSQEVDSIEIEEIQTATAGLTFAEGGAA